MVCIFFSMLCIYGNSSVDINEIIMKNFIIKFNSFTWNLKFNSDSTYHLKQLSPNNYADFEIEGKYTYKNDTLVVCPGKIIIKDKNSGMGDSINANGNMHLSLNLDDSVIVIGKHKIENRGNSFMVISSEMPKLLTENKFIESSQQHNCLLSFNSNATFSLESHSKIDTLNYYTQGTFELLNNVFILNSKTILDAQNEKPKRGTQSVMEVYDGIVYNSNLIQNKEGQWWPDIFTMYIELNRPGEYRKFGSIKSIIKNKSTNVDLNVLIQNEFREWAFPMSGEFDRVLRFHKDFSYSIKTGKSYDGSKWAKDLQDRMIVEGVFELKDSLVLLHPQKCLLEKTAFSDEKPIECLEAQCFLMDCDTVLMTNMDDRICYTKLLQVCFSDGMPAHPYRLSGFIREPSKFEVEKYKQEGKEFSKQKKFLVH